MTVINRKSLKEDLKTTITRKMSKIKLIPKKEFVQYHIIRKPKKTIDYFNKGYGGGDLE